MNSPSREIRIALVLYGGVSLAIYENGVVRCFYDLVRDKGVFKILRNMLDASATVDVIAGTSAGGINGLMLAAALENGTDFTMASKLWREDGDFGRLLREKKDADSANSVLDGEGYYQQKLFEAYQQLCQPQDGYAAPGEMDVFLTTTDLDGNILDYVDDQGHIIKEKQHRVVFQLKYRPNRKNLGFTRKKNNNKKDSKLQANILASLSRLTSSFPGAFPPFQLKQLPENIRNDVGDALTNAAGRPVVDENSFVDGGVLDNKPFGPALRTIFYRMPGGIVDRRLFFLEPDPPSRENINLDTGVHTPLKVAVSSLITIPAHESIYGDLDKLREHNQRIKWIKELEDNITDAGDTSPHTDKNLYLNTRLESLIRALLVSKEGIPSAHDLVDGSQTSLINALDKHIRDHNGPLQKDIDSIDVDYYLRIAFYLLYRLNKADNLKHEDDVSKAIYAIGRIIKTLKIIRRGILEFREQLLQLAREGNDPAARIMYAVNLYLDAEGRHWSAINKYFDAPYSNDINKWGEIFRSGDLSETIQHIYDKKTLPGVKEQAARASAKELKEARAHATVLDRLSDLLQNITDNIGNEAATYKRSVEYDERFYPLKFTAGVHELDLVKFVRISPRDAQRGLSEGTLESKVTGEEFAHFSAFLRKDWRSNDILRGRIDGICQILESLLNNKGFELANKYYLSDRSRFDSLSDIKYLKSVLPNCPDTEIDKLSKAWEELSGAWDSRVDAGSQQQDFLERLIEAAQWDAFMEDVGQVSEDRIYQDLIWGRLATGGDKTPDNVNPASGETNNLQVAQMTAREYVRKFNDSPAKLWELYNDIAKQKIIGKAGAIPGNILIEYFTQTYLMLWGMLGISLRERKSVLDKLRKYIRLPVNFVYSLTVAARTDLKSLTVISSFVVGADLMAITFFVYSEKYVSTFVAVVVLLIYMFIITCILPEKPRNNLKEKIMGKLRPGTGRN